MRPHPAWLAVVALATTFSACERGGACTDRDEDGLCAGAGDCDDENAARGPDCDGVPPPDCARDPSATGCACLVGSRTACYPGPPETAGVGECAPGIARCVAGRWGICEGAIVPTSERCDGLDEDCDGTVDDGVRSPCGGCSPACVGDVWGEPFSDAEGPGLTTTALGELTLARIATAGSTVWAVNSGEGTVSRIDSADAVETARYATSAVAGAEPSRVAVDANGDAWIANRAFEARPSWVRIAGARDRCVDRDGDGAIETSLGPDDVRAFGDDECVLASGEVGLEREVARALAIDGDRGLDGSSGGDAWIGLHAGMAFVEVDGASGIERRRIATPGFMPYGAAFDPWGILWAIARDGLLARIDPRTEEVQVIEVPVGCWLLYSLAIDREGRIALTGFSCDQVTVHEPALGRWTTVRTAPSPRGAATDGSTLWVAHTGAIVSRLSFSPLRVLASAPIEGGGIVPVETIGIGADGAGRVWAISGGGGGALRGVATRLDAETLVPDARIVIGRSPHTQGDPVGTQLFGEPVPEARASHVFTGCIAGGTRWGALHVAADSGTHGTITLEVRHAPSIGALGVAAFSTLATIPDDTPPFALALPDGGAIEVRVTLSVAGRLGAPRVRRIGVSWSCPGPA